MLKLDGVEHEVVCVNEGGITVRFDRKFAGKVLYRFKWWHLDVSTFRRVYATAKVVELEG